MKHYKNRGEFLNSTSKKHRKQKQSRGSTSKTLIHSDRESMHMQSFELSKDHVSNMFIEAGASKNAI